MHRKNLSTILMKENLPCYGVIAEGYAKGDFSKFIPYLMDDTVFESQWVFSSMEGKEEISNYLLRKGETFKRCKSKIDAKIVRCNSGVDGVLITQYQDDGTTDNMFVQLSFNQKGDLVRVGLCIADLFRFHELKAGEL